MDGYVGYVQALRAEIERLLAAALQGDIDHAAEVKHLEDAQADEVTNLNLALKPVISPVRQKGVLIAKFGCSADDAFALNPPGEWSRSVRFGDVGSTVRQPTHGRRLR